MNDAVCVKCQRKVDPADQLVVRMQLSILGHEVLDEIAHGECAKVVKPNGQTGYLMGILEAEVDAAVDPGEDRWP